MKIIIMGGSGLIGRNLAARLAERGDAVWVLARNPERVTAAENVNVAKWDARTPEGWVNLMEGADAVVNLAGETIGRWPWSAAHKKKILQSRLLAGAAVTEAFRQAWKKPAVLIQASAVGYYGTSETVQFSEASPAGTDFLAKVCVDWEESTRAVEEMDVRRIILRTGVVLARDGGMFPMMSAPFRAIGGGKLGSGKQWISWIHLEDEVRAIMHLLDLPDAVGIYNLTAPSAVVNEEFSKALARALNKPYGLSAPAFALRAFLGEMSTLALEGQRVVPRRLLDAGFEFKYPFLPAALLSLVE